MTDTPPLANPLPDRIVFFDGVCGLCDHSVKTLVARDRQRRLRYAPLQGETARKLLGIREGQEFSSMVFYEGGQCYDRSDAVWRILRALGGLWSIGGGLLRLIPRPLRNFGYGIVARNRYAWFGRHEACRLPRPEERELFLP